MVRGVGLLPAAPLLIEDITSVRPAGIDAVARAVRDVAASVSDSQGVVLVAGADAAGIATQSSTDLRTIGRSDVRTRWSVPHELTTAVAGATGLALDGAAMSLELSVLCLQMPPATPLLAMSVPRKAALAELVDLAGIVEAVLTAQAAGWSVVAVGDGSAGLSAQAPLHLVAGASAWQDAYVAALDAGDLDVLAGLGPKRARAVGSRGWAPSVFAAAVARHAGLRLAVTFHAAPRGVGYVVASSAPGTVPADA